MFYFWYRWSSWATELAGGALLGAMFTFGAAHVVLGIIVATFISGAYEVFVDPSLGMPGHNIFKDVGQRQIGIVLGALLAGLAL